MIEHPKLSSAKLDTINAADTDTLRKWRNLESIWKWSRQNDLLTESQHQGWMQSHPQNKSVRMYMIKDQSNNPIGVCGLSDIDLVNQRAEFSIYIAPGFQGYGHGSDALKLLCYHAFKNYPFRTIYGESFEGNPAIKVFQKVGFKIDGTRPNFYFKDGKFINSVLISIEREEFKV